MNRQSHSSTKPSVRSFDLQRLRALIIKESLQAIRDPSTLVIAFVLPVILLLLFAYAVSLDAKNIRIGVVMESSSPAAHLSLIHI